MSSEAHKHSKKTFVENQNLFNAKVLNFPNDNKVINSKATETKDEIVWKLYDKSNAKEDGDQLKAVTGICFMFGALIVMGLYSNLI